MLLAAAAACLFVERASVIFFFEAANQKIQIHGKRFIQSARTNTFAYQREIERGEQARERGALRLLTYAMLAVLPELFSLAAAANSDAANFSICKFF